MTSGQQSQLSLNFFHGARHGVKPSHEAAEHNPATLDKPILTHKIVQENKVVLGILSSGLRGNQNGEERFLFFSWSISLLKPPLLALIV